MNELSDLGMAMLTIHHPSPLDKVEAEAGMGVDSPVVVAVVSTVAQLVRKGPLMPRACPSPPRLCL